MLDLTRPYDIAIFGGGLCGFAAARRLAEAGRRVILIERRPVLCWEATWAFQLALPASPSPCATALREELARVGGLRADRADAPILEIVLDSHIAASGVDVLFYSQPVAVRVDDGRVVAVTVAGKAGEFAVRAGAFVDATEEALLWRLTGVVFEAAPGDATHVLFLNNVPATLKTQLALGDLGGVRDVTLQPSVWDSEVAVEFAIPSPDIRVARRSLPGLLRALRTEVRELSGALVTHVGVEPFPQACLRPRDARGVAHPSLGSLFGAGAWTTSAAGTSPSSRAISQGNVPLVNRIAAGEAAAASILESLQRVDLPRAEGIVSHSVVAPPVYEYDVIVCGGGTAGAFAAIAAARQGTKTALIEPTSFLGGIGTGGGIHCYYHGVAGGIQDEADARLEELSPLFGPEGGAIGFHPEAKKVVLQQMADEAGVELIFNTTVTGVETEPLPTTLPATGRETPVRRIRGVVAAGPEGNALYRAKAIVDSTGDGDVAVMAGAPYTFGRATDHLPHAYSLAAGRLDQKGRLLITNFDAGYCDPSDVADLTRARRRGLEHYRRERYDSSNRLLYIAPLIGLRNSRQIIGDYCLTLADEIAGREFPDVIAYARSHFDNHGLDYENESDEAMFWVWVLGQWQRPIGCEIPYRSLLPRGVEGLVMACRAISMTHDAHNQLRMQRDMQRIGEAAGIAAALAVKRGVTPRSLDVKLVQAELYKSGALGTRQKHALPPPGAIEVHEQSWKPPQLPARPIQQWAEELGKENPYEAVWALVNAGADALPLLREALKAEKPQTRLWAAIALAWCRDRAAVPELAAAVRERRMETPPGRKAAPLWQSCIVLLGRVGDTSAVPVLEEVLRDKTATLDALIAAVRALGRIGDRSATSAIVAMLDRTDLPTTRTFQVSVAGVNPVVEDARWQLELAAAEALARLGSPRPDIAQRHLLDPRAYVRRYAALVAARSR